MIDESEVDRRTDRRAEHGNRLDQRLLRHGDVELGRYFRDQRRRRRSLLNRRGKLFRL